MISLKSISIHPPIQLENCNMSSVLLCVYIQHPWLDCQCPTKISQTNVLNETLIFVLDIVKVWQCQWWFTASWWPGWHWPVCRPWGTGGPGLTAHSEIREKLKHQVWIEVKWLLWHLGWLYFSWKCRSCFTCIRRGVCENCEEGRDQRHRAKKLHKRQALRHWLGRCK